MNTCIHYVTTEPWQIEWLLNPFGHVYPVCSPKKSKSKVVYRSFGFNASHMLHRLHLLKGVPDLSGTHKVDIAHYFAISYTLSFLFFPALNFFSLYSGIILPALSIFFTVFRRSFFSIQISLAVYRRLSPNLYATVFSLRFSQRPLFFCPSLIFNN